MIPSVANNLVTKANHRIISNRLKCANRSDPALDGCKISLSFRWRAHRRRVEIELGAQADTIRDTRTLSDGRRRNAARQFAHDRASQPAASLYCVAIGDFSIPDSE
jgi:hypothetical protein